MHISLHIFKLTIEFNEREKCYHVMTSLIPDFYTGKPPSNRFESWRPAHHKKLIKANENKSIGTKRTTMILTIP